jgi:hypothetical protein
MESFAFIIFNILKNPQLSFDTFFSKYTDSPNDMSFYVLYYLHLVKYDMVKYDMEKNKVDQIACKFKILQLFLKNIFMIEHISQPFLDLFCQTQKVYYGFAKLARVFRYRRATIKNKEDLSMNPIEPTATNIIVYQNNSLFIFRVSELINLFMMALTNHIEFFMDPISVKNPYNNMCFNNSALYYIYFAIKRSTFITPTIIHQYFMANFDMRKFNIENEYILREFAIKRYIYNSHYTQLVVPTMLMLIQNVFTKQLKIDPGFSKEKLVNLMRPLLYLHYRYLYSALEADEKDFIYYKLFAKLKNLFEFNPLFGRKKVKLHYQININTNYKFKAFGETIYNDENNI